MVMKSSPRFVIEVRQRVPVLSVVGELDMFDLDAFKATFADAAAYPSRTIIVSLADATYLCARVFGALIALGERLRSSGRRLLVACPQDHIGCRIMAAIRYPFPWFDTIEEALAHSADAAPEIPGTNGQADQTAR
jgi:anti-anti-sigma regulatory factor